MADTPTLPLPPPADSSANTGGMNANSRLAMLPEELLINISIKLQSDDIFSLRQTCRDIETKSLHEFAKEYFSEKCFMFSTESLKVLSNIANSEKLRAYLRQVYFITALIKERPKHCAHHCLGHCWHPNVRQQEAFTIYLRDQRALQKDKTAKAFLVDAFSKLPRLKSLSLVDNTLEVPLTAEVRGLAKFTRTTGTIPHYAPSEAAAQSALLEHFEWQSYCWRHLIAAVAESGIKTLRKIETKMRSHLHGISPIDDLKFRTSTMDKLRDAFAELETFSVQFRSYAMRKTTPASNGSMTRARKGLADFAPLLSNVTEFGVSFDLADHNGLMCKSLTSGLDLSKLKKLKFDSMAIDGKTLGTLLASVTSVEKLTLHAIDLTSGNWVTILKVLKQLPALQHLHLVYLQQSRQKVYFLKQLDEEEAANEAAWGPGPPMPPGFGDDDDDWSEEHDSDDDEEMPDLIPQEDKLISDLLAHAQVEPAVVEPVEVKQCAMYEDKDYKAPGQERMPERGYFICLPSRDEIDKKLPLFIEECNVGNDIMDDDMGGLVGLNGLLQALGGPAGGAPIVVPAMPGLQPPAPPPAGQAQQPPPAAGPNPAQGPPPPGGQGGANAITAALQQLFAGGPPPPGGHHHMQFTIPIPGGGGGIQVGTGPPPPGANLFNFPAFNAAAGPPPAPPAAGQGQAAPGATNTQAGNTNAAAAAAQGPNPAVLNALLNNLGPGADNDGNDEDEWVNDVD